MDPGSQCTGVAAGNPVDVEQIHVQIGVHHNVVITHQN